MMNLGLFTPMLVNVEDLRQLGKALGGVSIDEETLRFGGIPDEAYLGLSTDLSGGCFNDEERTLLLTKQLGYPPISYVSIHVNSSALAFSRAAKIASAIQQRWGGKIDYSGAEGDLTDPFLVPTCWKVEE